MSPTYRGYNPGYYPLTKYPEPLSRITQTDRSNKDTRFKSVFFVEINKHLKVKIDGTDTKWQVSKGSIYTNM